MAKNRNQKRNGLAAMDVSTDQTVTDAQAMDTSESVAPKPHIGGSHRKMKGVQMKRTKNVRKKKAMAKAISKSEKLEERITKSESKIERTKHAKKLYE
ncbi:uncharacterized protein LOC129893442 [Solanum dulcamara]|uniref:uncharacterized protein LOC129893442 n=1 Tax=Solanum dulcamara TaxID=45834 RepID=UPI00248522A1|nr:uncharacterized protein LOC129893442 [Solanum dulcamara]